MTVERLEVESLTFYLTKCQNKVHKQKFQYDFSQAAWAFFKHMHLFTVPSTPSTDEPCNQTPKKPA